MMQRLFLANKYTSWYFAIIEKRHTAPISDHVERHHVIPKSLGGSNKSENIVRLSAREHFVCHKLLVKMLETGTLGHRKMVFAFHKIVHGNNSSGCYATSLDYELIRRLNSEAVRKMQLERFNDPVEHARQVVRAKNASLIAAEMNRGNPEYKQACSLRMKKRVQDGTHNFLGGDVQKKSWQNHERKEKHERAAAKKVADGLHLFQNPQFIAENRIRVKETWARLSPEERAARGRRVSEGRKRGKEERVASIVATDDLVIK